MDEQKPAWLKVNFDRWQSEEISDSEKDEEEQRARLEVSHHYLDYHSASLCRPHRHPSANRIFHFVFNETIFCFEQDVMFIMS